MGRKDPDTGKEGIELSALKQGAHSSPPTGLTGRGSLVASCEMWNKRKDRVCVEQCV